MAIAGVIVTSLMSLRLNTHCSVLKIVTALDLKHIQSESGISGVVVICFGNHMLIIIIPVTIDFGGYIKHFILLLFECVVCSNAIVNLVKFNDNVVFLDVVVFKELYFAELLKSLSLFFGFTYTDNC